MKRVVFYFIFCLIYGCVRPGGDATYKGPSSASEDCPSGESAVFKRPQNIQEALAYLNSLPRPVELRCFLKALERPLYINATTSTLSIQRADGATSPRVFIFSGDLIMAIKPDGDGTYLLELSELLSDMRSIKAEIELPLYGETSERKAYNHVDRENKTSCGGCHLGERDEGLRDGADVYSSYALKPTESQLLSLEDLERENYQCELHNDESRRCLVFREIFGNGEVVYKNFPTNMPTMMETFSF